MITKDLNLPTFADFKEPIKFKDARGFYYTLRAKISLATKEMQIKIMSDGYEVLFLAHYNEDNYNKACEIVKKLCRGTYDRN